MANVGERVKGHCPHCGPDKWAELRAVFHNNRQNDFIILWSEHRIVQCPACDTVYHQTIDASSEDGHFAPDPATGEEEWCPNETVEHWPPPIKTLRPNWLDKILRTDTDLYKLLRDTYSALDIDLDVLAAIGVRTSFDRGAELLGIDPAKTFSEKLDDLVSSGHISANERNALDIMVDAGNASAHRGWKPTPEQLGTMLEILQSFVHRCFVLIPDATKLKNAVPAKPKRRSN